MKSASLFRRPLFFLLLIIMVVSCSGPVAQKKTPLRVAYTNWWGDYTMIIAAKKGFFEKHGVEVTPVYYDVFSKAIPDLASSQLDGGTFTLGDTLSINSHTSVTAVAISDDGGLSMVVAQPDIKSIAALKGKKIGTSIGSAYELMIDEMLKENNLKQSDVILVDVDPENVPQALANNEIQAGFTWEPYTSQATAAGNSIIFSSSQVSGLFANAVVFRSDIVNQRPDDIRNYIAAWFEAADYRAKNADVANHFIAFTLNIPLDQVAGDARLLSINDNLNIYTQKPAGNVISIFDLAQANVDFQIRNGIMTKAPSLFQIFNPTYLGK